jgi:glycerol-1-phosphate dehydrogenase [NAD(P)+]
VVLPIGSGVLNDLSKWIAFDLNVPYVCFGTAASMNCYPSANVAATIGGVKSLLWARPPRTVLSGPAIRAVLHLHEIRSRFTIIDLARLVGILPQAAAEIVEHLC